MATLTRPREPVKEEQIQLDALLSSQVPTPFPVDLLRGLQGPSPPEVVDADVDPFADQELESEEPDKSLEEGDLVQDGVHETDGLVSVSCCFLRGH